MSDIPIPAPEDLGRLVEAIDGLRIEVVSLRGDIQVEKTARERAVRTGRTAIITSLAVAVVSLIAAGTGIWFGVTAKQNADVIVQQRTESRIAACQQDNIRIDQHNLLVVAGQTIQLEIDQLIGLSTTVPDGVVLPPEQQVRLNQLKTLAADNKASVDKSLGDSQVQTRDCTTASVEAYYATTTTVPTSGG